MIIATKCDCCNKYDNNVMIEGKRYCKHCFDDNGLDYSMMDHVEENREQFDALSMEF